MDVSNLKGSTVEEIIDSFFKFNFEDVIDVALYRLLVLRNNEKAAILANINSLIFDYTSINDFYELFSSSGKSYPEYSLDSYYNDVNDYVNSFDFQKDANYWKNHILNSSDNIKFYNLQHGNYKSQTVNVNGDSVSAFINDRDCSLFDFYGSIFSLYLSRIDRLDGCFLKTVIPRSKSDLKAFDKNTLLIIDVEQQDSFADLLNKFDSIFRTAVDYTEVDVDNYLDDQVSYYSIYDFSGFDENIHVYTEENDALTLNIYENSLELVYDSDLFSDVYTEHMAKNIESLINNVLNSPNQAISNIDILSDEEKDLISDYCKGKTMAVEKDRLLSKAFREHATVNPDALAVDDGVNQITYGELEKSTNSVANDLYENYNIRPGSRVALMLPRNYHYLEMVLALNKINAAHVPIDRLFPISRVEHMVNIAQADHFITTQDIAQKLDWNVNTICIEDLNYDDDIDIEIMAKSEDLFAIIFTSGTTGIPKGVMIINEQFIWSSPAFIDMFNFSYGDAVGSYLSFSFVASLIMCLSLYLGGSVRLFNENEQKNSLALIKTLKETHMNNLILPPSVGIPVYENEDLKLDYLILAGAKLNELSKKERHTKLVNFYGTTEIIFAISKIYNLKDLENNNVPIGRPVPNTWAYILDKNGNQMPIGVPGEICVSSGLVSQGYYNDIDSTNEVFVDNPYSDNEINKRIYCTGDIGFYNFDGEIEIIGREDDQLSVRGFRIESNEILGIMKSFKEISDIYLDVDNDTLIAYYTTADELDINVVKDALETKLPYYMIPSLFIELDEIPLTPLGKIDKSSLKTAINNEDIEISDEVIRCVVDGFKEVLNRDLVLIDDDFVALGGTSLSAMKLQLILKEKLNVHLSSNELIGLSTPKEIGEYIKYNLNIHSTVDEDRYTFDEPCPLSESQLNVYLDESVNNMGTAYNNSFKIDFKDNYSIDEIKNALIKLFEVFPILKAHVLNDDEGLSFAFDGEPEIREGSLNDMKSFVKPFELEKYLSRFLIADNDSSITLCADFHHLIFDGTSLNILLDKLLSILNGKDVDFVDKGVLRQISFEELVDSGYMDEAQEFFDVMLADADEVHSLLPCVNNDYNEFELVDTFDIDIENLSSFLQSHSITYNQFFTSVFAYTLSRFSGSDKVLFNIIEDGRGHIDLSESVGMFVKTLPVLMDCKNQDIDSYLKYSSDLINSVMKYDLYPFRILANEYDLNSNIMFQYSHNLFSDAINTKDLKYSIDELEHDLNADLSFYIFNNGENKLTIRVLYSSLYSKNFIGHFIESYKLILHEIIGVDELKDINYTSDADLELLDSYNKTEHPLDYDDIMDAFNENLSKNPDNRLVWSNDGHYSYAEGAYIADAIRRRLVDLGVEAQDCVSFLVPRSEMYLFSVLGVMSMGGIYVPLDDTLPNERIEFMIKDTDSKVVIVSDETYERAEKLTDDTVLLNISDILKGDIQTLSSLPIVAGHLACILYTSGTTGIPKGVKIKRKSLVNYIGYYVKKSGITHKDVFALYASIGFDVGAIKSIFVPMYCGACLDIVPSDIRLDMNKLNNHFNDRNVTHAHLPTQVAKLFINDVDNHSLDVLCTGGEKLGEVDYSGNYLFVDSYGPTEACVSVTAIEEANKLDSSSIGYLLDNLKAYLLDDEFRRVPVGAVGELYLAGIQVADGYLNRNEETAKSFLSNPFDGGEYDVIYRTGDVARILPDGTYGIVGRRDSQVKIRGNRVELSEVEATIRNLDITEDITVQTIKNGDNNELVAYIVPSVEIDKESLRNLVCDYVNENNPPYMVPSFVVKLECIPLNVNGKVDKSALPDVDLSTLHEEYVAPTTEDEKIIVEAFEKVFNQKIGVHDDFVRLGGDSLTAIRLVSYLDEYDITAVDILSLHTPHAIAKNIKKAEFDLDIYTLESGCPLNEPQLNVYLDIIANNKFDSYIIPLFMEISKKYDVNQIIDALNGMMEVHPILGMCVSEEYEVPYLIKGSEPSIVVESDVDEEFAIEFITKPFDLYGSLCRFLIVENEDNYCLYAGFHHIVFDAISKDVFKRDLKTILNNGSVDIDDSFLKISAFNQQIRDTDEYQKSNDIFESMLADSDETGVLLDSVLADGPGTAQIDLDLDFKLFKSFLEEHTLSENVLFTSAFAYTLSRFVGSDKVLFNILENGRGRFNNFDSIGMYVNTIPVLMDCKNQDVSSFMEYSANLIYDVLKYDYYPFRVLARKYDIDASILFQFLPEWIADDDDEEESVIDSVGEDVISEMDDLNSDLSFYVIQNAEDYTLSVRYCDKYSKDLMEHFIESYKLILHGIINSSRLNEINYTAEEDIEILDSYNNTEHSLKYPDILDAFNDNLSKYPDNKLVSMNNRSYTYAEGAYFANKIAKRLTELGVEPEDCVSFLVERSEYYMFSVLGILSIGSTFVPLDDKLPDERIKFIIEDTDSKVIIVSDETCSRAGDLSDDNAVLLNISEIINDDAGTLSSLPVTYGDLATILYTSGTSGIPKGVKTTRKAILNVAAYYCDTYGLSNDDVYGLYPSIGFDAGLESLFKAIYAGACLSVVPEEIRYNMNELNSYFISQNVTHTIITTQVGKLFAENVDDTSLKYLFVGGEKLGKFESPQNYQLVDEYGPTEGNNFISSINNSDKIDYTSIGKLNYNSKVYILDNEGRRVPVAAVGELCLAGYQIAKGYLNREDETNESFVKNPFDDNEDYSVLYRTGDLVRTLPDGTLGIVGRSDSQVKIRGNRVELSEIEAVINEIDYIQDVTVQTVKHENNNELAAYVVASDEMDENTLKDDIQDYVRERKPEYMVPSFVIRLDEIPLNINSKVDKSALPDVDVSSLKAEYVAPTNETEKHIIDAFENVFNQKGIGLNDDFVRLGGDSIIAIRVISLLEKNDISCSARDILNYKTPYLIAQNVQSIESISYDAIEGTVDLLPIQKYFFDQNGEDTFAQYYILKSEEKLDKNTLQASFNELCNVHDMLRADYSFSENGEIIQEILPVNTEICEINEYDIPDNFEESLKEIFVESSNSLSIENKLIEINLIHHNSESYLMFIIHHLIIDGVSWNILITDLTYIYSNLKTGNETELSRPYPYKNWVEDVKNLVDNISPEEKQYWTKINGLLDESAIKGNRNPFVFNVDVDYDVGNLLTLSEEEYWALAIARAYKKTYGKDVIFNRETYGRDESIAKLNRTIGWFTSQYPILVNINNDYDDVSLMNDVYNIKTAFKEVNNLGLNYYSLIYTTEELTFKHCPVTFNFLSSEFTFKNELFESIIPESLFENDEIDINKQDLEQYGITFNVVHDGDSYNISGYYAGNTYIGDEFEAFIGNIKSELEFIGNHEFKDNDIVCCLSESQLGIYLDEKVNEKDTAYSNPRMFECDSNNTVDEIKDAVHALIKKHPILKGRVLDTANVPLLICDSYPSIEIVDNNDYSNLIRPFDLDKSLARFSIEDNGDGKFLYYNIHHIICDATTRAIINKELEQALMGKLDDAVDLGFVYDSHDSFESKYDNKYKTAQEFFSNNFTDIDEVQYLPMDIDGKMGSVSLPIRGIRENVELFTKNNGTTVGNLLNAVFAYTYSRFTGSEKVYYNFTEHGRHENYSQNAVGMFVRTIPIIVDCENRPIGDYMDYTSDLILKSMTYSVYPFRLLARKFDLTNSVIFEYNHDLNDSDIGNDMVVRDEADKVSDFLCAVNNLEDGFVVTVSHLDKFSQYTAKQFVKTFKEVLTQILEKESLADIKYISNEDAEILNTVNHTGHSLAYDDVLDAFNDNLSRYPKNNLVSYNDNVYSYDEGAFIANEIANSLKDMGVEKTDNVAFLVERSELYMFSVLGILSAGAVYVPLDASLPDKRLEFMIKDTESEVVIVSDGTYEHAKELSDEIRLLNISDILKGDVGTLSKLDVSHGDLACILYTSGTTGVPKGVKITRKSVINVAETYIETYGLDNNDVYGLFSAIGFDVSSFVISVVMCAGACLSVIPEEIRFNMVELNRYFIKQNVSHAFITTQVGKLFMQSVDETSLDVLLVAGEKLGEFESPKGYRLIDAYGPTEAFAFVSSIDNSNKLDGSSVGMLNNNTRAYILDNQQRLVPCGAVGELYLAGYQVADGYLNRPEENGKAFIDNPFDDDEDYAKLYGTGDMVRLLPDGSIGIVGRRDSQVKIRGNRLELTEVESVIREIDYVDDISVQTIKHDTNNELVAYVVVSNDLDGEELKDSICDYVNEHKPEYMVPSFVVKLESIPLNVNGKVDKHALPDVDRTSLSAEYVAPRDENEKEIVEAFEKALNLEKISIYDDFIRLGGDSLTAIKVLSYIESNDVTMGDIFAFRTPEAIAKNMSDFTYDLDLYSLESGCPLNSAQINVFADVVVYNKRNAYQIPGYIAIPKEYGLENILNSLDKLLDAHPILGMRLSDVYEVNEKDEISNFDLLKDLIKTAEKFGIKEIMNLVRAYGLRNVSGLYNMIRTTIQLFKGRYPYLVKGDKPPISVESNANNDTIIDFLAKSLNIYSNLSKFMIVESEKSYYLVYLIHHIIFDATSAGLFKHDLLTLLDGGNVDLDDTFLKASAFTHQMKNSEKFDEAGEFYHSMLSDIDDVGDLRQDNSSEGYTTSSHDLIFDKAAFNSFLNKAGISKNVLFSSIFAYTLSQFVDGDRILFTMVENGRDRFNEKFIGMTSNVMPVVVDCKDQDLNSFMEDMADTVYGVTRHSYYPILLLYQKYDFEVKILFQFVPNWIADDYDDIDELGSREIINNVLGTYSDNIAEFFVQIFQNGDDYRIVFTNSKKYSEDMIENFRDKYISILSEIINADMSSNLGSTIK